MLSSLLILAQAAAETAGHAEDGNAVTKITQQFGVNWPNLVAQILSFSIVAFVLWRFAFKPVLATLDERQRKIEAGLKYAEEMQAKLAAAQEESAAILKKANADA